MNTGEEFVKKIRPLGAALFLLAFVLFLIMAFSSGRPPIPGYEPPQTSEYYAQSKDTLSELKTELETNVFPALGGGPVACELEADRLLVTIAKEDYFRIRAAILRYFDPYLFEIVEAES